MGKNAVLKGERNMDIKSLDLLARTGEPMPKYLEEYEENYFLGARYLYRLFEAKVMTLDECKREKQILINRYNQNKESWEYMLSLYKIKDSLIQLKEQGFNSVLEWEVLEVIDKALKGVNNG